jgi:hypothetical protein
VKFNLPMAWSAHVLGWSLVDFADVSFGVLSSCSSREGVRGSGSLLQ